MKKAIKELEQILTTRLAVFAGFVPKTVAVAKEDLSRDLLSWHKKWSKKEREEARLKEREQCKKAFYKVMGALSDNTFNKTILGKNSPFEVTDEDWQSCGIEFDDLWMAIEAQLKTKK